MGQAKEFLFLSSFGITDLDIASLLAKSHEQGVSVHVALDAKERNILPKNITLYPHKKSSLMHRKILLIDKDLLLLGSTNITPSAFHLHKNNLISLYSPSLVKAVLEEKIWQSNNITYYPLPTHKKEALLTLLALLQNAKKRIYVAQYTFTHPSITEELIKAHERGVLVEIFLDRKQTKSASRKSKTLLLEKGVPVFVNIGPGLLHHKCALIDDTFVTGSANWTKAGFEKNEEYLLFLKEPPPKQFEKILTFFHSCKKFSSVS